MNLDEIAINEVQRERPFTKGDLNRYWQFISNRGPFERFDIQDNRVSGPCGRMMNFMQSLTNDYFLPDLSFIYFQQDSLNQFGIKTRLLKTFYRSIPIFVSARKRNSRHQILFCDWHYDPQCHTPGMWNGMVSALINDSVITSWQAKINQMIWRGGPNDGVYTPHNLNEFPRGRLVMLSELHPNLIDATFNNYPPNFVDHRDAFTARFPSRFVNPVEMARYKYQIDVDGVTATFTGLAWKLLSGSLVFKQDSPNKTWFHDLLGPWEHYIPLRNDLGDLLEKLDWARVNDEQCKKIAANGRQLIIKNALPDSMRSYCAAVLKQYKSLITD
jgi:hypothetical protein